MRSLGPALLLLAGCGADPDAGANVTANQLGRLSTPDPEPVDDPLAPVRLQPLEPGDVTHAGLSGPGCRFSAGDQVLLAANGGDAIARLEGRTIQLVPAGPLAPSGGFFRAGRVTISVGRTEAEPTTVSGIAGWPGRITVTSRRPAAQLRRDGMWRCGP